MILAEIICRICIIILFLFSLRNYLILIIRNNYLSLIINFESLYLYDFCLNFNYFNST